MRRLCGEVDYPIAGGVVLMPRGQTRCILSPVACRLLEVRSGEKIAFIKGFRV